MKLRAALVALAVVGAVTVAIAAVVVPGSVAAQEEDEVVASEWADCPWHDDTTANGEAMRHMAGSAGHEDWMTSEAHAEQQAVMHSGSTMNSQMMGSGSMIGSGSMMDGGQMMGSGSMMDGGRMMGSGMGG